VVYVLSEPKAHWKGLTGQLDEAVIKKIFAFEGAGDWLYLVCGPPPMLDTIEDALLGLGIPAKQIVSEQFYYD
jgi:NAD(P)H-flavin reductase